MMGSSVRGPIALSLGLALFGCGTSEPPDRTSEVERPVVAPPEPDVAPPAPDPTDCPRLDAARGATLQFVGRVAGEPDGPIGGAHLELVARAPTWSPLSHCAFVAATTVSEPDGTFRVDGPALEEPYTFYEVVGRTDTLRGSVSAGAASVDGLSLILGHPLALEIQCGDPNLREVPAVRIFLRERAGLVVRSSPALGVCRRMPTAGARCYDAEAELENGMYLVVVSGACGYGTRSADVVQGNAPEPVIMTLPHAEAGAIEVAFRSEGPRTPNQFTVLFDENDVPVQEIASATQPIRVERLPPGPYRLAPDAAASGRCVQRIEVAPGGVQRVEVDNDGCVVAHRGPREPRP